MDKIPQTEQALEDYIRFARNTIKRNNKQNKDLNETIFLFTERLEGIKNDKKRMAILL